MDIETLISRGNFQLAIQKCMASLKSDLNNAQYWYLLGKAFRKKKETQLAQESFYKATLIDPSSDAYFDLKAMGGSPENKKFIRDISSGEFYQYILNKLEGVSKTDLELDNEMEDKKTEQVLPPPPPPPPQELKKQSEIKTSGAEKIKSAARDLDELIEQYQPPSPEAEEVELPQDEPLELSDLEKDITPQEAEQLDFEKEKEPENEISLEHLEAAAKEAENAQLEKGLSLEDLDTIEQDKLSPEITSPVSDIRAEQGEIDQTAEEKIIPKELHEGMDLILDALKEKHEHKSISESELREIMKSIVEREVALFIIIRINENSVEFGDKKWEELCRIFVEGCRSIQQSVFSSMIEFEKHALIGSFNDDVHITACALKKNSGVLRLELERVLNTIL